MHLHNVEFLDKKKKIIKIKENKDYCQSLKI